MNTKQLGEIIDSPQGKIAGGIVSWTFRALVIAVITLAGYQFRELAGKVENAVPRGELSKALTDQQVILTEAKADTARGQKSLWEAMGSVTKSVTELSTTVNVLNTRVELQNQNQQMQINDLKNRVNGPHQ